MLTLALLSVLAASEPQKPTIAVLYFDNLTNKPDFDVLRKGMADMMVTDLVAWDGVRVVDRSRLEEVLTELKLQHTKAFDPSTASKVGKLLAADYLLAGQLNSSGGELIIDANLRKVQNNQVVTTARAKGSPDHVFDLEQELVGKVTQGIDLKLNNASARKKAKVPDFDALLAYSKAIDLSDQGKVDEANKAIAALVSRSPAFLMARERKQEILKKLEELDKLRQNMVTESVLQVGKVADEALKDEAKFDALPEAQQKRLMAMRWVKGRFMMRVLKSVLAPHSDYPKLMMKGKEAQALQLMRGWVENQRRLLEEHERWVKARTTFINGTPIPPRGSDALDDATEKMLRDAKMGQVDIDHDAFFPLVSFVLEGRCDDGNESSFTVAPALGDVDAKEQKALFDELDKHFEEKLAAHKKAAPAQQPQFEWQLSQLAEAKAEALERLDRDEDAIAAYQKFLDAFPTSSRAEWMERQIKQLLGAEHEDSHSKRERWAKALQTCDDMDIRVGTDTLGRKVRRMGLLALAAHAAELEKACKPSPKNRGAFAMVYRDNAMQAAHGDDCDGFRYWFKKYVEADGSVNDMMGYQKNWTPWCELGDVTKSVVWLAATLDQNWTVEMTRNLTSVRSYDGKMLSLNGGTDGRESLYFRLEAKGPDQFECKEVTWHRLGGDTQKGSCQVTLTKLAKEKGEFDEGNFSAHFEVQEEGYRRKMELTAGRFRLRRQ